MKKVGLWCLGMGLAGLVGAAELSVEFTFSAADVELATAGEYTSIGLAMYPDIEDLMASAGSNPTGQEMAGVFAQAGITEVFLHPALPDEALLKRTPEWQKRVWEYEYLRSGRLNRFAEKEGFRLVSWKDAPFRAGR